MQAQNHASDFFFANPIFSQQLVQNATVRQFSHLDGVFRNLAICVE